MFCLSGWAYVVALQIFHLYEIFETTPAENHQRFQYRAFNYCAVHRMHENDILHGVGRRLGKYGRAANFARENRKFRSAKLTFCFRKTCETRLSFRVGYSSLLRGKCSGWPNDKRVGCLSSLVPFFLIWIFLFFLSFF